MRQFGLGQIFERGVGTRPDVRNHFGCRKPAQCRAVCRALAARDAEQEASGIEIACPGGVHHFVDRLGRHRVGAAGMKNDRPLLAAGQGCDLALALDGDCGLIEISGPGQG